MTLPRDLVFVRHGLSEANIVQRLENLGMLDALAPYSSIYNERFDAHARLTERGVMQAQLAGEWLRAQDFNFTKFYASPHIRARETAAHLALDANWSLNDLIRERDWGEFGAASKEEREELFAASEKLKGQHPWYWKPTGGESLATGVRTRCNTFLKRLERLPESSQVIAVSHGEFIRTAQFELEKMTPDEWVELEEDKAQTIKNGTVLHYTRTDPATGIDYYRYRWVRQINTFDLDASPLGGEWRELSASTKAHPRYSDAELLETVEKYPRIFEGAQISVDGRDIQLPEITS